MTASSDQAAIAALTQRMVSGWAYGEAETIANLFVEDGTMILAGVFCNGRDEIRDYFAKAFEGKYKGTQVTGKPIGIRVLGPDVAILLSSGGVLESGETEVSENGAIRASWLVVRRDGEWRLAAYQNSPRFDASATGVSRAA
ncbi:SgcJ/EcaC family oxidoreductase [Actinophytocola sp.]|uniref:SgcJ/EcaC family oxidoreductase n=1 Tax=Actinophytocola sp. TaxID=1872138 RepID=UPI002ED39253